MKLNKKSTRKVYKAPAVAYEGKVGTRAGQADFNNLNEAFG